ncbi:MAG: HNH endonuclease [bacterium]
MGFSVFPPSSQSILLFSDTGKILLPPSVVRDIIEWCNTGRLERICMGSKSGIIKVAAKRVGLTLEEYLAYQSSGLKRCTKCKTWRPTNEYHKETSRGDGLSTVCKACRIRKGRGPSRPERIAKQQNGLAWCRDCSDWHPVSAMCRGGQCRQHHNESIRKKYATNENYRKWVKQVVHSRKRKVRPIPVEAMKYLEESFDGKCAYCGKPASTYDHIVPVSKGGQTTPGNIVPACASCNSSKNNKDVVEWRHGRGKDVPELVVNRMIMALACLSG